MSSISIPSRSAKLFPHHCTSCVVPEMRGFGDSDKPAGIEGYDVRALSEEFRVSSGQPKS